MHSRVDTLQEEHIRLRSLLDRCEAAPSPELSSLLNQLREALRPHVEAKQALYAEAVRSVQAVDNKPTELSLLGIFRTNLGVVSGAVLSFLEAPDPQPARQRERLRTMVGALRSLMDTEEKVVFPLCRKYSVGPGPGRPLRPRIEESRR
ncbi:MAG TPA: hypothetical protein VE153_38065 [Myxococcus sp.]|jgi:hypothetical protein|nr:hypothetical protein [Myxococcus sp.]